MRTPINRASSLLLSKAPTEPLVVCVMPRERAKLQKSAVALREKFGTYDHPKFLRNASLYAYKMLPGRIKGILAGFATDFSAHQYGGIIFRNLVEIDQESLGHTPATYKQVDPRRVVEYGFVSVLMHAGLGAYVIMQRCQRSGLEGGMVHSIIPTAGKEMLPVGEGSARDLFVHTEDSYLFSAARFMSMFFLRNYERASSNLYSIRSHDLSKAYVAQLFQKLFKFPTDPNTANGAQFVNTILESILFGKKDLPFLRFDPQEQLSFEANQSPEAQAVLAAFWQDVKQLIYTAYVPEAGDFVILNNMLCCHGRSSFLAGFKNENGTLTECPKRWMLRVMSVDSPMSVFEYSEGRLLNEEYFGHI